ncbi:MAG: peptidoglycan DD-metalloendopeptidase family protein [Candidatus Zixiibacteriota bacterium]|nr:MAG: peptidoglycan DD-metalloendopeptidase family protein [candidate division Zixibacteria bacterium]
MDDLHTGIDIVVPEGTPVYAVESGYVKAIITLSGNYSSWRIVVGDSAGPGECDAWMYAHIIPSGLPYAVGDYVEKGAFIAKVVGWPSNPGTVEHLHFAKSHWHGDSASWANNFLNWNFVANPLEFVGPVNDTDMPVLENAWGDQLFAFSRNQMYATYFAEGAPIFGDIDIVCRAYDRQCFNLSISAPYMIEYKVEGDSSIPWTIGVCFADSIGCYSGGYQQLYRATVYQDDPFCHTEYTADNQALYFNVTNSDGDMVTHPGEKELCWQTPYFHNGDYTVSVRASDLGGNSVTGSMVVAVKNLMELSGTVTLEGSTSDYSGAVVTVVNDGVADTTDESGSFLISSLGGGSQLITARKGGYSSIDTTMLMNENRQLDVTLYPQYVCGDADASGAVNLLDVTFIINYLYKEGPAPVPPEGADANGDGSTNLLDVSHIINYLYKEGPEPICPTK